jgi:2-polyprenyl-3-methyl-5-hydroxy-6-metoxy-1,4-benzoquinol methylase
MTSLCPACQSTSVSLSHHSTSHGLTTVRCKTCGLRFIRERIDAQQQTSLYEDEDTYRHFAEAERSVAAVPQRRREWANRLSNAILARDFALQHGRRPRLLDIGCGVGDFLVVAREAGFEVHGVELSPGAARLAKQHHQLEVTVGDFKAESREGYFEAITIIGVLEHVRDPSELLSHAGMLLAPGGMLLVYTPVWGIYDRVSSGLARLTRGHWSRLIDRRVNMAHLQIFEQRTLLRLAEANGLEVTESLTLCEYNLPVRHYLRAIGIESAWFRGLIERGVDALIDTNLFFCNNQRVLAVKRKYPDAPAGAQSQLFA